MAWGYCTNCDVMWGGSHVCSGQAVHFGPGGLPHGGAGGTSYQVDPRIATEKEHQRPFVLLRANMELKGGKWLAWYGDCEAWGDTPDEASRIFDNTWNGLE